MGYTTADRLREKLREDIKGLLREVAEAIESTCSGVDEYKPGYWDDVYDALRAVKRTVN